MEIIREFSLQKLWRRRHNGLIKVITGLRRSGKSYLLRTLFKRRLIAAGVLEDHIVEMAFDDYSNRKFLKPDRFYQFAESTITDGGQYYFLLDEVQMLKQFESVLNGLLKHNNVDIYVTGSNARLLSKDVITEFRGRGDEIHLMPLSFKEFMSVYSGSKEAGLQEYAVYGGLPPVVLQESAEDKAALLLTLLNETYLRDIAGSNRIRNVDELNDLLDFTASSIGSLTNPEKLKNTFHSRKNSRITASTVSRYLNCLADAFLIEPSKRFDVKGKQYIGSPLKYYFQDLGIRNARLNFRQLEMTHSIENIIYNELRRRGYSVDVGVVPFYDGKIKKSWEIDFIANKGSDRLYIQAAYALPDAAKREQETRPLRRTGDAFRKIVITFDALTTYYDKDGIQMMNVYDFLLNEDSLN